MRCPTYATGSGVRHSQLARDPEFQLASARSEAGILPGSTSGVGRLPPNQFIPTPFSPRGAKLRETNSPSAFGFDPNKRRALAIEKRGRAIKSRNHNASND